GKIVLVSPMRPLKALDKPLASRLSDEELAKMAAAEKAGGDGEQFTPETLKGIADYFNQFAKRMKFLMDEGAAVMIDNSPAGSGGTVFVEGANLAVEINPDIKSIDELFDAPAFQPQRKEFESRMMPQAVMATEDYNRLVRMIQQGVTPRMTV